MSEAGAVRAGKASVEVTGDLSPLAAAVNRAANAMGPLQKKVGEVNAAFSHLGSRVTSIGQRTAAVGGAIAAAGGVIVGAVAAATKTFTDAGSAVADFSARTGVGSKAASEYAYAISQVGGSMGDVEAGIKKMQVGLASGSDAFARLGLSVDELKGLKPEEAFERVLESISKLPDATSKTAAAVAVFGKSGTSLIPLADQFRDLQAEAAKLGIVLTDDQVKKADDLGDAIGRASTALQGIAISIGSALAEPVTKAVDAFTEIVAAVSAWAAENPGIVRGIAVAAGAAVVLGGAIVAAGTALIGVGAAITGFAALPTIVTAVGAAASALAPVILPIVAGLAAAGAAAAGIAVAFAEATGTIDGMAGVLDAVGRIFGISFREQFYDSYLRCKKWLADLADRSTFGIFNFGDRVQKQIDANNDAIDQRKRDEAAKQAERDRARAEARSQTSQAGKQGVVDATTIPIERSMVSLVDALRATTKEITRLHAGGIIGPARGGAAPQNNLALNAPVPQQDKRSPFRRLLEAQIERQGGVANRIQRDALRRLDKDPEWLPSQLRRMEAMRRRFVERQQAIADRDQAKQARQQGQPAQRQARPGRTVAAQQDQRDAFLAKIRSGPPMMVADAIGKAKNAIEIKRPIALTDEAIEAEARRKMRENPLELTTRNKYRETLSDRMQRFEMGGTVGTFASGVAGRIAGGGVSALEEQKEILSELLGVNKQQLNQLQGIRDNGGLE